MLRQLPPMASRTPTENQIGPLDGSAIESQYPKADLPSLAFESRTEAEPQGLGSARSRHRQQRTKRMLFSCQTDHSERREDPFRGAHFAAPGRDHPYEVVWRANARTRASCCASAL